MQKTFFEKSSLNQKIIFFVMALLMTIFSIYLTSHYFDLKYPTGFEGGSLCNINSFFNCDTTSLSTFGNIAGVPIALFGILVGSFAMLLFLFNNDEVEGALYWVLLLNVVGCVILFAYSLIVLRHLCPFCTLYYITSIIAFYIFHKNSETKNFNIKYFVIYGIISAITFGGMYSNVTSKESKIGMINQSLIKMFFELPNLGAPNNPSPHRLASATQNFADAPLRFTIFSDFQCPACKMLTKVIDEVSKRYEGKINIQYFFYPLDHNCNANMQQPLHAYACKAAYIASCVKPEEFIAVHDKIFENQESLNEKFLSKLAEEYKVTECASNPETKEAVVKMITQADLFSVKSTPTTLLNGVKIEGVRAIADYYTLMDEILKRSANK